MKYKDLCEKLLLNIGGKQNVSNVEHCMTRLRVTVVDKSKVKFNAIDQLDGVMGVVEKGNQVQVIIGNEINAVYNDFIELAGESNQHISSTSNQDDQSKIQTFFNTIAEIFNPIVPALAGAGMIKALLVILKLTKVLTDDSQTFLIINTLSDSVFTFLPILLAYSSAKKFKSNPYLAVALAATMLHPTFSALQAEGITYLSFMGIHLNIVNYASSVIPIILGVFFMSYVERLAEKIVPSFLKVIFVPALTMFVAIPIVLLTVGPFAQWIGTGLANGVAFLFDKGGFVAGLIYGGIYSAMVVTGLHHGMVPVLVQGIASKGYNNISPASGSANMGQAGAAFAVWLKSKQEKTKAVAAGASISALLGVTEPAIYGVNLRLKKPFLAASIGGAIGGAIAVGFGGKAYAMGGPSFATLPMFIGDDGGKWLYVMLGFVVAFIVAAISAYVIGFEEVPLDGDVQTNVEMADVERLVAPVSGELIPLVDVPDPTFAKEILGYGFAINPAENEIVSPISGEVVSVFKTGHAIGIKSENGLEVLVHVGIDTVKLDGKYFDCRVKNGDKIVKGDPLVNIEKEKIIAAGYSPITMVIITNKEEFPNYEIYDTQLVSKKDDIMKVGKNNE